MSLSMIKDIIIDIGEQQRGNVANDYKVLSRWRNGWTLVERDGKQYLRRAFRGQYRVNAKRDGLLWIITEAETGKRVHPDLLR